MMMMMMMKGTEHVMMVTAMKMTTSSLSAREGKQH